MTSEPMPAEPEGLPTVKDSREYAIVVLVDHKGVAEANANGVTHEQAAEWLRAIADLWDPPRESKLHVPLSHEADAALEHRMEAIREAERGAIRD